MRFIYTFILENYVPIKNQNDRNIIELNNLFGYLYFIIPYIYIKFSTQRNSNNKDKNQIEINKMRYSIHKKISNFSNFSKFYLLFINGILYFFVYIIIYYSSYIMNFIRFLYYFY